MTLGLIELLVDIGVIMDITLMLLIWRTNVEVNDQW